MEPSEFGQLVKSLRKATNDPLGNRWTRESLGSYIHLSINQLGRLERGDRKYFDNQTLILLADAFKLTPIERKEF
jgi:transcriptional regulator with XRE-family HTH domain